MINPVDIPVGGNAN